MTNEMQFEDQINRRKCSHTMSGNHFRLLLRGHYIEYIFIFI